MSSYYDYGYFPEEDLMEFVGEFGVAIIGILLAVVLVVAAVAILEYVFQAVGLYTIAKRRGINNPWLAWIPVANVWILGSIADQYQYVARGRVKNKRKILLILGIASLVVSGVFGVIGELAMTAMYNSGADSVIAVSGVVGTLSSLVSWGIRIAHLVFWHMALYDLYNSCNPENSVLFLVLGIVFGVTVPFFIFGNRKKDGGMPPRRPEPQYVPPQYDRQYQPWEGTEQL
ncbi:MAG: hypothetical protein IJ375_07080 [Oscillospiraceae bacterium]|nr:hypothetical protein [Oscillospiraceae bacterium]